MIFHHAKVEALSAISDIAAGHPLRSSVDSLPAGEIGVVQMRNIDLEVGVEWEGVARVQLPPARHIAFVGEDDVIISTRGTNIYALALSTVPFAAVCSPHFFILRIYDRAVEPKFLAWQINQAPAQAYLQRGATGSHILNIRREVIERLEIMIPSRARQNAIVAFAEAAAHEKRLLTGLIENRQQQMNALAAGLRAHHEEYP